MKRPHALVIACICSLVLALSCLSACGNDNSGSTGSAGSSKSSSAASNSGSANSNSADNMSKDDIRGVFEQALVGMTEFYKGVTPVGENIYYAGGADGANAVFALIVPEDGSTMIFFGPATVGDDNMLTVTDSATGSSITFSVVSNGDGTLSFSMGEQYGAAVMSKCSSGEIADVLANSVASAPASTEPAQDAQPAQDTQQ